jgi:NAD(P)-dependent dehydrogenase (short-subunit alcohol dehydrogenase family)
VAEYFALAGAATLILTARRKAPLLECKSSIAGIAPGCNVIIFAVDVSLQKDVERLFSDLQNIDGVGLPDVLVNNAGSAQSIKPIVESEPEEWWKDWEVNVRGIYLCSRAYLKALDGKPGTIINTSSGGSSGVAPGFSGYAGSKAGVNRLTEYIDAEHSQQGVRCFAFHPGGIVTTDMGQTAPSWLKPYLIDTVDLAAGTCLYLATPRADYLRGRYVSSNWDLEAVEAKKEEIVRMDMLKTKVSF